MLGIPLTNSSGTLIMASNTSPTIHEPFSTTVGRSGVFAQSDLHPGKTEAAIPHPSFAGR